MKIAIGSDEKNYLTDHVVELLKKRDIDLVLCGPLADKKTEWTDVAEEVATRVAGKECEQGILFCCTGTGVSMAANKVPGIRAALCADAQTASGARKWNDANVLAISLRATSPSVAEEIIDAWFSSSVEDDELENIRKVSELEKKYCK